MRFSYIAPVLLAGVFSLAPSQASALAASDYAGSYDLEYTSASADLHVEMTIKGTVYTIPVKFQIGLEDEKIPYSYVDQLVANADALIENYYPGVPAKIQDKILLAFEKGMIKAIDTINAETDVLPDDMVITAMYQKYVTGTFVDTGASGEQFDLYGTLDSATGDLNLMPAMRAKIDASGNFVGAGSWYADDLDVSKTVQGVLVHVMGDVAVGMDLAKE